MAVFRSVIVFMALLAIGTCCQWNSKPEPADSCCQPWRAGSRTEPAFYSTKGTGPSSHASSVVCFYYKTSNCVVCKSTSQVRSCCTEPLPANQNIPENEYLIVYDAINGVYNLAPLSPNGNSYLSPSISGWSISWHGASITKGVVVDDSACWQNLKTVIDAGSMQYLNVNPEGFLYVVDE